VPQPPTKGSTAPAIAVINPQTGVEVTFGYPYSGFTLVLFLRGTWCPYCTEQLKALAKHKESLEKIGFRIACVSPESQNALQAYVKKSGMDVPLFHDANRAAAKAFGVHYWLRYDGFNLAHPALFIIGPNGETLVSHVSKSMSDLPVGHLLETFLGFLGQPSSETSDAKQ
jgi:peroxiredoxin